MKHERAMDLSKPHIEGHEGYPRIKEPTLDEMKATLRD